MTLSELRFSSSSRSFSRRALVGSSLAAAAIRPFGAAPAASARQDVPADPTSWRTWLLTSADELRPAAPADPTQAEFDELLDFQARRSDDTTAVARWGSEPAVIPWVVLGLEIGDEFGLSGPRYARAQGLLRTALYDAVIATLDAQAAYPREAPAVVDSRLTPMEGVATDSSSFPSLHAAVAGAASTVFTSLFPDAEPGCFDR